TTTGGSGSSVGAIDLSSGASTVMNDVQSYALSSNGHHLALRRSPPQGTQNKGADLVIRDLSTNTDLSFGNVSEYAWSDDGATLAMTIDVPAKTGNAIQVFSTTTNSIRSLDSSDMAYSNIRWRKKSDDLVVFRSRVDEGFVDTGYAVLAWKGAGS